jgi:hypothetical protein
MMVLILSLNLNFNINLSLNLRWFMKLSLKEVLVLRIPAYAILPHECVL